MCWLEKVWEEVRYMNFILRVNGVGGSGEING